MQPQNSLADNTDRTPSGDEMSPVACPRCDWLGTKDQTAEAQTCPKCHTRVSRLRQKGLDNLRSHYWLLSKMGRNFALTVEERDKERERLEEFFRRIEAPL
ncbi:MULTISPECIES: hypothetical protein [unclassified Acidovorax]|uniref:hypothetical protein n=1 Tax=unclassified Acidovorax TaxID=2684926 RepID=UPI000B3F676A|nr:MULTISPECIES: hypothetical protein [unclassified Acidovorax]